MMSNAHGQKVQHMNGQFETLTMALEWSYQILAYNNRWNNRRNANPIPAGKRGRGPSWY